MIQLNKIRGDVHMEDNLDTLEDLPDCRKEFVNSRDVHRIEVRFSAVHLAFLLLCFRRRKLRPKLFVYIIAT